MPPESLFRSTVRRAPLGVACWARRVRCLLLAASLTALAACAAPAPVQVEERGAAARAASVPVSTPTGAAEAPAPVKSPGKMPGAEAPTPAAPPWRSLNDAQPEPARPASGVDPDRDSSVRDSPTRTGAATGTVDWRATQQSPQPPQINWPPSHSRWRPACPPTPCKDRPLPRQRPARARSQARARPPMRTPSRRHRRRRGDQRETRRPRRTLRPKRARARRRSHPSSNAQRPRRRHPPRARQSCPLKCWSPCRQSRLTPRGHRPQRPPRPAGSARRLANCWTRPWPLSSARS